MALLGLLFSAIAIGALINVTVAANGCAAGWKRVGDKCYVHFGSVRHGYDVANELCESFDSKLIVPRSQEATEFFVEKMYVNRQYIWIGCDDTAEEGRFVCWDDLPIPLDFIKFGLHEGKNGTTSACVDGNNQDCVYMAFMEKWWDGDCRSELGIICEKGATS